MIKITNESKLFFQINKKDFTADIINSPDANGYLFIPQFVVHENQNYIITSIGENSFKRNYKIKSIQFANDSKVCSIGKEAFFNSSLKKIIIPSSLKTIKRTIERL